MAYTLNVNLTQAYVTALIERNGFTDVSSEFQQDGPYAVQNLDGDINIYQDLASVRKDMALQWAIMQNG